MRLLKTLFLMVLLTVNGYASEYKVVGQLQEVINSHGAQSNYLGDTPPHFNGVWKIDFVTASISGQNKIYDVDIEVLVKLAMFELKAVVEHRDLVYDFSGVGEWQFEQRLFTYFVPLGESNSDAASDATGTLVCKGHRLICRNVNSANLGWEGVEIELQFDKELQAFSGKMTAYELSGSGATKSKTKLFYTLEGEI